jgi:cytochrome c oxidase subunit 1/terminal oxidase heme-binding subunit I
MLTERMWYSNKLGWIHLVGYMVGTAMLIVGFDALGVSGLVRKAEVFPLIPAYITPEVVMTVGAFIADVATLGWLGNLVLTLLKGRTTNFDGVGVDEVVQTVVMLLEAPSLNGATKPLNVVKSKVLRARRLEK